jgi:hypothetical protein
MTRNFSTCFKGKNGEKFFRLPFEEKKCLTFIYETDEHQRIVISKRSYLKRLTCKSFENENIRKM